MHPSRFPWKKLFLPLTLGGILFSVLFFGHAVPFSLKTFFYSISLSIKAILLFVLPFIIFSFIFSSLLSLQSNVMKFILSVIATIYCSNLLAVMTAFSVGYYALPYLSIEASPSVISNTLLPLWQCTLPKIPNEYAIIAGFICGLFFSFKPFSQAKKLAKALNEWALAFLKYGFIPLLPIFVLGFVFKLEHEHLLAQSLKTYGPVFFVVLGVQVSYVFSLYFITAKGSFTKCFSYLKNIFPATLTGFCTISSAATMPVLIVCAEKNLPQPALARMLIPMSINAHTLGSAIGLTLLSLTTLLTFGYPLPSFTLFAEFAAFYAMTKFATVAVPGGAVVIITPLLESFFHFSPEMVGLMTAIYMLFDPFGTAINVTGNGFFPLGFSKLFPAFACDDGVIVENSIRST